MANVSQAKEVFTLTEYEAQELQHYGSLCWSAYDCHDIRHGHTEHCNLLAFIFKFPLPGSRWWLRETDERVCLNATTPMSY
jgi:hypothetical protein